MSQKVSRRASLSTERTGSVFIYALTEPDGTPRYVGRSSNPRTRLSNHQTRSASPAVREWIAGVRARGEEPGLRILYEVQPGESPDVAERRFIQQLGTQFPLLNWRMGSKRPPQNAAAVKLREWLEANCMTQTDLALRLGLNQCVVSRWIVQGATPGIRNALKLQALTGVDVALWHSVISTPDHPADTPPPRSAPASPAPLSDSDNDPLSTSRANAQPRETTSGAERSHSAHGTHSAETARHTAQESS